MYIGEKNEEIIASIFERSDSTTTIMIRGKLVDYYGSTIIPRALDRLVYGNKLQIFYDSAEISDNNYPIIDTDSVYKAFLDFSLLQRRVFKYSKLAFIGEGKRLRFLLAQDKEFGCYLHIEHINQNKKMSVAEIHEFGPFNLEQHILCMYFLAEEPFRRKVHVPKL